MTTTQEELAPGEKRTYGNWRKPESAGVAGIPLGLTLVGLGLFTVSMLVLILVDLLAGAAMIVFMIIAGAAATRADKYNITLLNRITERTMFKRAKRRGFTSYRSGLFGVTGTSKHTLPGVLSGTTITEHLDAFDEPFALIHWPHTNQYAVVLECMADGGGINDQEAIDNMVSYWGGFGVLLSDMPNVTQYSVTVEDAPAYGEAAVATVLETLDTSDRNQLAKKVTMETIQDTAATAPNTSIWIAVTYDAVPAEAGVDALTATATEVGRDLGAMKEHLGYTGAGTAEALTGSELAALAKISYDPGIAQVLESARLAGSPVDVEWADAGPKAAEEEWDHYLSMDSLHTTFSMATAPRGLIHDNTFARVLSSNPAIDIKRVTFIYDTIDRGVSANLVERDVSHAHAKLKVAKSTAGGEYAFEVAKAVSYEEVRGAALQNFTMVFTVTTTSVDYRRHDRAVATFKNMLGSTRALARIEFGEQANAFIAGLPFGYDANGHNVLASIQRKMS